MSKIIVSEGFQISDFHKKELELVQTLIDNFTVDSFTFNFNPKCGFFIDGNREGLQNEFLNLIILISESYRGLYPLVPTLENKINIRCNIYINNFSRESEFQNVVRNFYEVFYKTDLSLFLSKEELNYISVIREKNFLELSRVYNLRQ